MIYVVSGDGWLWEDGVLCRLEAHDIVYIGKGVEHVTFADPGTELSLVCFFPFPDFRSNYIQGRPRSVSADSE